LGDREGNQPVKVTLQLATKVPFQGNLPRLDISKKKTTNGSYTLMAVFLVGFHPSLASEENFSE